MNSCTQSIPSPILIPPNSNSNRTNLNHQHRKKTISLLQKCRNIDQMTPIHGNIIKNCQQHDHFIVFELLRVSSKCNAIDYALKIFQQTRKPNVYLYTALIDGLVLSGMYRHGIRVYVQMIENYLFPDDFVISSVLKACAREFDVKMGREVHAQVLKFGMCSSRSVKLKLIGLYGKCGELEGMKRLFDEMPERDVVAVTLMLSSYLDHDLVVKATKVFNMVQAKDTVCCTAMIDGLVRNGQMNKALEFFRQMQTEGVRANEVTVVCVLSACAQLGALELGKWIHSLKNTKLR